METPWGNFPIDATGIPEGGAGDVQKFTPQIEEAVTCTAQVVKKV